MLALVIVSAGCTGETPSPQDTTSKGSQATRTTTEPTPAMTTSAPAPNYGEKYDADDLFPTNREYNWKDVDQNLAKVQSIIGTDADVISHASKNFEINGVTGNLLIVEGKTGQDSIKSVAGYLAEASSWISFYETQDDVSLGDGIEARRLLTLKDNGGTATLLWRGHAFAFFVYLSSSEVNPYDTGKQLSEDILDSYSFLYDEPTAPTETSAPTTTSPPTPTAKPATTTKEEVAFDAIAVGGWSGSITCDGGKIVEAYFLCPGGKIRGGQTIDKYGFSILGTWVTKEQTGSDGTHYNKITFDYTYTAQLDRSVSDKEINTWFYNEKTDTLLISGSTCQRILYRVEGAVEESDCKPSTTVAGGDGGQCTSDYQCGQCWYCDDGTCRYGGQGASGCYRGYSDGYIKLENQWFPIS